MEVRKNGKDTPLLHHQSCVGSTDHAQWQAVYPFSQLASSAKVEGEEYQSSDGKHALQFPHTTCAYSQVCPKERRGSKQEGLNQEILYTNDEGGTQEIE